MDKKESKKRKCGPRVKTGCITCRIRRVKCDEGKPACERCTSTGRKCDGYTQPPHKIVENAVLPPVQSHHAVQHIRPRSIEFMTPFSVSGTDRDRQFFQFYCVQSAFDLSVYMNSSFWYNMILQYSHKYPVVRQAVVAFGASHTYAINVNSTTGIHEEVGHSYEQAKQYDKAIRWLRTYMETGEQADPHVILICCALFFSCENGRGNREAALQHLEKGLSIINAEQRKKLLGMAPKSDPALKQIEDELPGLLNTTPDQSINPDIDEELLYVFSRLDVQATLCQDTREPVLDLDDLLTAKDTEHKIDNLFYTITDIQRSLDFLHNRLAKFLTKAGSYRQDPAEMLPAWVIEQKKKLHNQCAAWEELMNSFIAVQSPAVKYNLQRKHLDRSRNDPASYLALQIQLLILHHRCWWMLFRSSYPLNPAVFTMSPNPRAEEILDVCECLGFSLPVRPSASKHMSDADVAWKLISEIGVAAPLFVLATKCTDVTVRTRARKQLEALREHRNGTYDKMFLTRVMAGLGPLNEGMDEPELSSLVSDGTDQMTTTQGQIPSECSHRSPLSASGSEASQPSMSSTMDSFGPSEETHELLGWARKGGFV